VGKGSVPADAEARRASITVRATIRIGTLPPVGALDQLRTATGEDGLIHRVRSSPRLVVAIAGGAVVLLAWIAYAIYVTSDQGARAGLGVVIAWPAILAALAIISLPFIGGYLLIRGLSPSEDEEEPDEEAEESESDSEAEASPAG
jgi:hypothetical protein